MPLSIEADRERKRANRRSKHYQVLVEELNERWPIDFEDQGLVKVYITVPPAVGTKCWMEAWLRTNYQHITPNPDAAAAVYEPILGVIFQYDTSQAWDLVDFTRVKRTTHYP